MRSHSLTRVLLLSGLLLLAGCQVWQPGGTPVTSTDGAFTITPPAGWQYASGRFGFDLLSSKEGLVLQTIAVDHRDLTKPKDKDKPAKREIKPELPPFETAEAIVDELRANRDLLEFNLKSNTPATVAGRPGFKLVYSYRTKDKLNLTEAVYGVIVGKNLWQVSFRAPSRHYFERDLPAFEAAVKTLQVK